MVQTNAVTDIRTRSNSEMTEGRCVQGEARWGFDKVLFLGYTKVTILREFNVYTICDLHIFLQYVILSIKQKQNKTARVSFFK